MKTILHVIPTLRGGGAERQLALLAVEQARRGWNVHVALRRRDGCPTAVLESRVQVHELGDLRRGHPMLFARLGSLVRKLEPDVFQTWLVQMDVVGGLVALVARVPWVLTERCSKEAYNEFPLASRARYMLGRRATAVVANSKTGANDWRAVVPPSRSVSVVTNAIDVAAIAGAKATTLGAGPHFLSVGRLVHQKAHDVLLKAVALLPRDLHCRTVILGEGEWHDHLSAMIKRLELSARVSLLPYCDDWWGLLKTSCALLNASRFEGQPNVVLEAMAASCPVVVSDIPSHRDVLDENSALFVARDDPQSLASAMNAIITDPQAARDRARRAAERIAGATISATADSYERIYADLARV
jgi:glycosyltransferase involved in cell wall biosynthesis